MEVYGKCNPHQQIQKDETVDEEFWCQMKVLHLFTYKIEE